MIETPRNLRPVMTLEITREGQIQRKTMRMEREQQLVDTLLGALYPQIHVATVDIPVEPLDAYEQTQVELALNKLEVDDVKYALIGASGSAKNGKFYAVDKAHEKAIAERFAQWPEAAITYFGILVSSCGMGIIDLPKATLIVVPDHKLGTNDCRGWIRRSVFERFSLADNRFYQFRLAFHTHQTKGSFKVMEDDVANLLGCDFVLPESSFKPSLPATSFVQKCANWLGGGAGNVRRFEGRIVAGIRDVSRPLEFSSSYTLTEHAPMESIEREILPVALEQVRSVKESVANNDFGRLFEVLGTTDVVDLRGASDAEHTSGEHTVVEAVLKADSTGWFAKHPFIQSKLQRILAKWAYKLCTSGNVKIPAGALSDDGYLIAVDGKLVCGSDWLPLDTVIAPRLDSQRFLVVRYPIRMKDDLLPVEKVGRVHLTELLAKDLARQGCQLSEVEIGNQIVDAQLLLDGTFTLNAETAKLNGGDFDFDWISLVEETKFPLFVADRFGHRVAASNQKDKKTKKRSPWWNIAQVAFAAKGNQIGSITDLKTSCLAAGRPDLAEVCAVELQKALDGLKHGTVVDQERIADIRREVGTAQWLRMKNAKRVDELPLNLDVPSTDRVGHLYNVMRKEIQDLFSDVRPLGDYRGLLAQGEFSREMFDEAGFVSRVYGTNVSLLLEKRNKYVDEVQAAAKLLEACPPGDAMRKKLNFRRTQAQAALHFYDERSKTELRNLIAIVRKWAQSKEERASDWLAALYAVACKGSGNGSIVFYAFPQRIVDQIVERTGGRPVTVRIPDLANGEIVIDQAGRVLLVDELSDGNGGTFERETFLMQVSDGVVEYGGGRRERTPLRVDSGRVEVRDGKAVLPGSKQKPGILKPKDKQKKE